MTTARDVIAWAEEELALSFHPKQVEALRGIASAALVLLCLGRRSGKSLLAAVWAVYDAVVRDLTAHLRPGEPRYVVVVCPSQDQARRSFQVIRGFFDLPRLAPLLDRETADELVLVTGVIIKVLPCSSRTVRGMAISTVIMDEAAHFVDTTDGHQAGEMVYRALAPSVAQFGDEGRIIALSTPRGQRGVFWRLWQLAGDGIFKLHAATWEMNPAVPQKFLDRERERDIDLFRQEYAAEFLAGGGAFLSPSALEAARGVPEHSHGPRCIALDPAFVRDSFALAVCCHDGQRYHVERVRTWDPPVEFGAVMDQIAEIVKEVHPWQTVTDQFASEPVLHELRRRGVDCESMAWTAPNKSEAYASFKSSLNTGMLSLVDDKRLYSELAGLVAEPTAFGFQVEAGSGHDDLASAAVLAHYRLHQHIGEPKAKLAVFRNNPFTGGSWEGLQAEIRGDAEPGFKQHPVFDFEASTGRLIFRGPHKNPATTWENCKFFNHPNYRCRVCEPQHRQWLRAEHKRRTQEI